MTAFENSREAVEAQAREEDVGDDGPGTLVQGGEYVIRESATAWITAGAPDGGGTVAPPPARSS